MIDKPHGMEPNFVPDHHQDSKCIRGDFQVNQLEL